MLRKLAKGFGVIEILVTLGVLTVGILGVTKLHSVITQQSLENKARNEALMIAQSRIETMRNYTGTVTSQATFNTTYADTNGYANSTAITGVSAAFTRTESISTSGNLKNIGVRVAWTDPDGESQNVTLSTKLSYIPPRSVGDSALTAADELVDAPTGRARLGEGQVPQGATTTSNGDGTALYKDGSTELRLASGNDVVLTLSQACQTDTGACIDFVKIRGRIYIDASTQSNLSPGNVFVVASDAAYCARYYTDTGGTVHAVTPSTSSTRTTTSGSYKYFDYTCYIGGGWHGNIGVLLGGGNGNNDKFCVGDPTSTEYYADPIIASRRVYRGMLYKMVNGSRETVSGTNPALTRYYSQGIKDSTSFPVSGAHTHDFVVASSNSNDSSNCTSTFMKRTDATVSSVAGGLFTGNPTDFVCLNNGYLDDYDTSTYGNDSTCPYDPSDPPSSRHTITGKIRLTTTQTSSNAALAAAMYASTSDGAGNCSITTTATWSASGYYDSYYSCDIYDWGAGWNGYIQVNVSDASQVSCTTSRITGTSVTTNQTTGYDFTTCTTGTYAAYSGTVTASGSRKLTNVVMSGTGSTCTLATGGLSYTCQSYLLQNGATWSGTISYTISGGYNCTTASSTATTSISFTNKSGGNYTQNIKIAANSNGC